MTDPRAAGRSQQHPGRRRLAIVVAVVAAWATTVTAPVLAAVGPERGEATGAHGYALVTRPELRTHVPPASLQYNSTGGTNSATRNNVGNHYVDMPGLANRFGNSGAVHVTAVGATDAVCRSIGSAGVDRTILRITVLCSAPDGTPVDSRFAVSFTRNEQTAAGQLAHVRVTATGAVSTSVPYNYNSSGAQNTAERLDVGQYRVDLPNLGTNGGHVVVDAWTHTVVSCTAQRWGPDGTTQRVLVACTDGDGQPADATFALTYVNGTNLHGRVADHGYALADRPTAAAYLAPSAYSANTAGGVNRIRRLDVGRYNVRFEGLGAPGGHFQVNAVGSNARCDVRNASDVDADAVVRVQCRTPAGVPVDSRFSASWMVD